MPTRKSHFSTPLSLSGVVVSDLHLFARRSDATRCLASIEEDLDQAKVLVLNGDTFDFRWSTMGHYDDTLKSAIAWLENLARKRPHQEIHLILGIVVVLAGFFVFTGAVWARTVGVVVAVLWALVAFAWLPWYPVWAVLLIAVSIFIIWALTVHGRDIVDA